MGRSGLQKSIFDLPKLLEILAMYTALKCVASAFISGPKLTIWPAFLCWFLLLAMLFMMPDLKMPVLRF